MSDANAPPPLSQAENIEVTDFKKCDFRPMFEYFELQKEKKKQLTAAEKKQCVKFRPS